LGEYKFGDRVERRKKGSMAARIPYAVITSTAIGSEISINPKGDGQNFRKDNQMNDSKKLELLQKAKGLFAEGLAMIENREAELAKSAPPSSGPDLRSDREKAVDMIKTIHQGGAFNVFDRELRSLPPGEQVESEVLKQVKEAHATKRLSKEELLS
jgi:hypothetical protein